MRTALKKGFVKKGFIVDTAENGEEGSYLAQVNTYDVIVLDLNLPGKDGLEILQEIRAKSKTQRIIILSARSSVPDKILGLDMGANDYINKFRMEKAITLMTGTELSFTEIAEKVGFTTSRYFSTAFKQYTGETPTQYKEKRKQEKKNE